MCSIHGTESVNLSTYYFKGFYGFYKRVLVTFCIQNFVSCSIKINTFGAQNEPTADGTLWNPNNFVLTLYVPCITLTRRLAATLETNCFEVKLVAKGKTWRLKNLLLWIVICEKWRKWKSLGHRDTMTSLETSSVRHRSLATTPDSKRMSPSSVGPPRTPKSGGDRTRMLRRELFSPSSPGWRSSIGSPFTAVKSPRKSRPIPDHFKPQVSSDIFQ